MSERVRFERWRPHPWHGLAVGPDPPRLVQAYIEITPFDPVKYEIDKLTGYLRVDRPQRYSSLPPTLYGFIPRTYCAERVAALMPPAAAGDHDPLDICVLSERPITRAEVLLAARVVGGLALVDRGEADDKIIAVLVNDPIWGEAAELGDLPPRLIDRLQHYFATYKLDLGGGNPARVQAVYGAERAQQVVRAAMADYEATFGGEPVAAHAGQLP